MTKIASVYLSVFFQDRGGGAFARLLSGVTNWLGLKIMLMSRNRRSQLYFSSEVSHARDLCSLVVPRKMTRV